MNYNIKKSHPIIKIIHSELKQIYNKSALNSLALTTETSCKTDIYGFEFNSNNLGCLVINGSICYNSKSTDPPEFVGSLSPTDEVLDGYKYYNYTTSFSIKLKNFLTRFPQFDKIEDWSVKIIEPKIECKYYTHSSGYVYIGRPDKKRYKIKIATQTTIFNWINPLIKNLTTQYYREIALDEILNIKRDLNTYINGIAFKYNYLNGTIEIYDIIYHQHSIFQGMIGLFEIINNEKIISEIKQSLYERFDKEIKVDKIILNYNPDDKNIEIEL